VFEYFRKYFPHILLTLFIIVVFLPLGLAVYLYNSIGTWPLWAGLGEQTTSSGEVLAAKTYWDVLELVIIPFSLAIIAYLFSLSERHAKEQIEAERHLKNQEAQTDFLRNEILQSYLAEMSKFLLENNLANSEDNAIIRDIARARTLATVRELDGPRKGILFRFLYEAQLLVAGAEIISLYDADLRGINLIGSNCYGANLAGVNASRGMFFRADLRSTNLRKGYFEKANFRSADLRAANLTASNLSNANLSNCLLAGADLSYAILDGAIFEESQLMLAHSLNGAIMPNGKLNEAANSEM
jgi:uncharacterized protein YjbI with pentapeptide repeats